MNPTVSKGVIAKTIPGGWSFVFYSLALMAAIVLASPYAHAAPGPFIKLSGKVTNSLTHVGVAGATVKLTATGTTITMVTDAAGNYVNNKVQVGSYTMNTSATNFTRQSQSVSLLKGPKPW